MLLMNGFSTDVSPWLQCGTEEVPYIFVSAVETNRLCRQIEEESICRQKFLFLCAFWESFILKLGVLHAFLCCSNRKIFRVLYQLCRCRGSEIYNLILLYHYYLNRSPTVVLWAKIKRK